MMERQLVLCADIGGTHISAALLDKKKMALVEHGYHRGYVNSQESRTHILDQWDSVLNATFNLNNTEKLSAVLISVPGPFDYTNGICLMDGMFKYQSLLHMDLKSYFATKYQIAPDQVKFINDAQSFLLGEVYHHKLHDKRVVGLTLGTGLGSAYYNGSQVEDLNYGSASFRAGIAEDYISTRGMISYLQNLHVVAINDIKALVEAEGIDTERRLVFDHLSEDLVDFLNHYIIPLAPDTIVLGGSIAKAHSYFLLEVQRCTAIPIRIASFNELNLFYGLLLNMNI